MTLEFNDDKSLTDLANLHEREEEELAQILSKKYGIAYADLSTYSINTDALRLAPEDRVRNARIAIFDKVGKKLKVGILSPSRKETKIELEDLKKRGFGVETFLVSSKSLERAWARYKDISFATTTTAGALDVSHEEIEKFMDKIRNIEDVRALIDEIMSMKKAFRISRIVEVILASAIAIDASDIHLEPQETFVLLRFRLDGVLVDVEEFDYDTYKLLLSRIKLLSGLKLNLKNNAQDGRFSVNLQSEEIDIRSSILPGSHEESVVLRILNPKSIQVPIKDLGIEEHLLEQLLNQLDKPNGMILNTGPTGSGKTTTLYAFLRHKKNPDIKIITIEDPVEYRVEGIVQTQVDKKAGYTFSSGLRSSLRQDPDIIMVGEIRDTETAEIAINSALTGHLVFSTLHTNDAAGTFPRLIDLGINSKIISSAINVVIAQRLVRKLCNSCKKEKTLTPKAFEEIKKVYEAIDVPYSIPELSPQIWEADGCEVCNHTGYKGRIGIFEAIFADKEIEKALQGNPSRNDIAAAAAPQKIPTMRQDGVLKILKGMTTTSEVERVVGLSDEIPFSYGKGEDGIIK